MSAQGHQPGGQPTGGQFMATAHSESPVALGGPDALTVGDMNNLDAVEQGVALARLKQLREAGMAGHATDFRSIDGWGVRFALENQDGTFDVSLNDDRVMVKRRGFSQLDPAHTMVADASSIDRAWNGTAVTADDIREAYAPAMVRARTARRWAERSGLRSNDKVRFGLPELVVDEDGRKVGSMDITMNDTKFTVVIPRGSDKAEAYVRTYRELPPRMTAALMEDATEAGGGPAGTDMIGNAIAVTLLEEGETW